MGDMRAWFTAEDGANAPVLFPAQLRLVAALHPFETAGAAAGLMYAEDSGVVGWMVHDFGQACACLGADTVASLVAPATARREGRRLIERGEAALTAGNASDGAKFDIGHGSAMLRAAERAQSLPDRP